MATANNPKSGNNRGKNTYTKKSNGNNRKNNSRTTAKAKQEELQRAKARQHEIYLFIYLAAAVFLLCSSFGWCGVVGNFISGIIFGLFGSVAYILPVYLFFSAAFLLSNGAQKAIVKRVLCIGIFLIVIAFICQMVNGVEDVTVKLLYDNGSKNKLGGGVILGGILALLYRAIGMTGSVIVTILLTIIGVIIVLNISIIDLLKEGMAHDDEDEDDKDYRDEFDFEQKRQGKGKDRDVLSSIKVLEAEDGNKRKKNRHAKNRVVYEEEVHELKPIPHEGSLFEDEGAQREFDKNGRQAAADDFFNKPEFKQRAVLSDADMSDFGEAESAFGAEDGTDTKPDAVTELTPVKRRRKKTMESAEETKKELEAVSEAISSHGGTSSASDMVKTAEQSQNQSQNRNQSQNQNQISMQSIGQKELEYKEYQFPPIELLKTAKKKANSNEASVRDTAMKLKSTLENFGVNVTITNYSCGPSVTRYELQPDQGVKVSKIVNLADDIKLNLAAADIRIEAPIPGKAAIGIEVPNKESEPVYFRDLLESERFKKFPSNIAFAVGKDISGQVIVADIAKMPHLLVAGATGSGKSVCINTLIMSILYKANPNDVKLIMVDPKQVELSIYNGIPHMLIPVVTDPKKAAGALNWAVMEMTNRYQMFAQYNVRNLQGYNEKVKTVTGTEEGNEELKKLPQIIIIVDELADLMMVAHGEVEDAIVRLSQLARAAGIHLVIATQRPSVDVITGLIKANVPSRIAMTVSSGVDSRTILDMNGAEKLLGKGDMLFYPTGYPKPVRVQGAFLSDDEIARVVGFLKTQNGENEYDEKVTQEIANTGVGNTSGSVAAESEYDDYFADAGKFIIGKDKASIGMLQRVYKIGFNRAARIMDQLSEAGVVGPEEGTKPRKVLMTMEEFENYVEEHL